jgi:hypothetical protein
MTILSQLLLVAVYTTLITTAGVAVVMTVSSAFRVAVLGVLDRLADRARFHYEIACDHYEVFVAGVCEFLDDKTDGLDDFLVYLGDCAVEKYEDALDVLGRAARSVASLFRGRRA